eukprot:TRINITY_DN23369_c0_g1_i1.p1 TRINITY_DN23369_c0_g1~~TRINITY_DN23369_c0_g1_i1.p1  ORF type:complete len:103 (-),score=41.06 TRINITY_DN23369_c0_g1_i1:201-509(-)
MDIAETVKEEKVVKKTEYILPYQDSGIGNMVNLRVVGIIWIILLLLKIICKDEEWGFFLMFTSLLLLFILPFFITKELPPRRLRLNHPLALPHLNCYSLNIQ